ncbi:NAD(P)-dependent oxidoreductase [Aestuariicella hydrocarbonica]|uniref:NAD(P)-dependent oxidoreductase n=1 Tax=Pseudomaricurvus hydrocarbonicus TaxID=1470433 RepID=A0A9E5MND5_9GAMM|nr:NAD(P)-dependent oxidoreductase [Aestuariicella hydrocarbonica]NHO67420.1 NAD(P)-dependent oxidoreductase [Aestuariicella hydrocarbonica]
MKCGFIGLGSQGAPMAQAMIDGGYDVMLWARRAESLQPFVSTSATVAGSVRELGEQVQFCGICVVDDAGVCDVCDELIPAMAPGGCIAIHATVHPQLCRDLAAAATARGLYLVDAPVSGGGSAASDKTLTVMVGGSDEALKIMRPVFETFSGLLIHLGDVGAGQMAKLVNNSMMAANLAIAHNSLAAASALGVNREAFVELVKVSSGRSFAFEVGSRIQNASDFAHGARMLNKDVGLLGEALGDDASYPLIRDTAQAFLQAALKV